MPIASSAALEFKFCSRKRTFATMFIGVGQGIAVAIEPV